LTLILLGLRFAGNRWWVFACFSILASLAFGGTLQTWGGAWCNADVSRQGAAFTYRRPADRPRRPAQSKEFARHLHLLAFDLPAGNRRGWADSKCDIYRAPDAWTCSRCNVYRRARLAAQHDPADARHLSSVRRLLAHA